MRMTAKAKALLFWLSFASFAPFAVKKQITELDSKMGADYAN